LLALSYSCVAHSVTVFFSSFTYAIYMNVILSPPFSVWQWRRFSLRCRHSVSSIRESEKQQRSFACSNPSN
ncbi:unnamed protein product, partial [Closterium sp. NIES-54]